MFVDFVLVKNKTISYGIINSGSGAAVLDGHHLGVVFFILAKYGFPVILKTVEDRKAYIDNSLKAAREANEQLANAKVEGEKILAQAREEQHRILSEAAATRDRIIKDAQEKAFAEGNRLMEEMKKQMKRKRKVPSVTSAAR